MIPKNFLSKHIFQKRRYYSPFLVFTILLFAACENDLDKVKLVTQKEEFPIETAHDIEIIYSDSGLVQAKLNGPLMEHYVGERPYIEMKEGIHIEFYNGDGSISSELTANYAISYENEKVMEARNDVVVINEKGDKLNTELLIWEEGKETIHIPTSEFVKITTEDEIIHGYGLEANQDFSKYKITNISGIIKIKDEEYVPNP